MHPLGFLRPAKAPEPIYCCSLAKPMHSPGAYKVHNDPNRDLHTSIFRSFMDFVVRRQRQATLLKLALSHVEESTDPLDEDLVASALEYITGATSTTVMGTPAISSDVLGDASQSTPIPDLQLSAEHLSAGLPQTSQASYPAITTPILASLDETKSVSLASSIWDPSSSRTTVPPCTFDHVTPPTHSSTLPEDPRQSSLPVPTFDHWSTTIASTAPSISSYTSHRTNAQAYTTPTRSAAPARLSVSAKPFVPGLGRGFMAPGFSSAFHQTHSSSTTPLPTLHEGLSSSSVLASDTTTTQHAMIQKSGISDIQSRGGQGLDQGSQALFGLLNQHTQSAVSTSPLPSPNANPHLATTSQHLGNVGYAGHISCTTGISSVADAHQDVNLTVSQHASAPTSGVTSSMRTLEEETQHLISAPRLSSQSDAQPRTNSWHLGNTLPVATPQDNQAPRNSDLTLLAEPSFGFRHPVSQSVPSSASVSSSSRQNAIVSAPIIPPTNMSESSSKAAVVSYNRAQSYASHRSSSAGSWRSQQVSNSASSSQYRPKPHSSNSYSFVPVQSRTVASSSRQSQQHQQLQPLVVFDMEQAKNNPLTESTSYVIHLTSRLDYGPVLSHRYFICPQNLNEDWIELTLFQWWCRGESFKMKAEKWDMKCEKHNKFFRMTLRPNLMMRADHLPSFGISKVPQLE